MTMASKSGSMLQVSQVVVHDDWINFDNVQNDGDIAVLVLSSSVTFNTFIKPICLNFEHKENTVGKIAGWGVTQAGNVDSVPMVLELPLENIQVCAATQFIPITSNRIFCAGLRDDRGPCRGDSGGGFYTLKTSHGDRPRYVLTGIVSRASSHFNLSGVCDLHKIAVFTRLSSYKQWIEEDLGGIRGTYLNEPHDIGRMEKALDSVCIEAYKQRELKNYDNAMVLYNKVAEGNRCLLGEKHKDASISFFWLTQHLLDNNDYAQAYRVVNDVIAGQKRMSSVDNIGSMQMKEMIIKKMGRYKAVHLFNQLIGKRTRVLGTENVKTLSSMHNKAVTLDKMERYNKGIDLYNKVIKKRTNDLDPEHERTLYPMLSKVSTFKETKRCSVWQGL